MVIAAAADPTTDPIKVGASTNCCVFIVPIWIMERGVGVSDGVCVFVGDSDDVLEDDGVLVAVTDIVGVCDGIVGEPDGVIDAVDPNERDGVGVTEMVDVILLVILGVGLFEGVRDAVGVDVGATAKLKDTLFKVYGAGFKGFLTVKTA